MNERLKKLLPILGFIALGLAMAFFLWFVFFRSAPGTLPGVVPPTPTSTGSLPRPGTGQIPGTGTTGTTPDQTGLPTTPFVPQLPSQQLIGEPSRTKVISSNLNLYPSLAPSGDGVRAYNPNDGKFYRYDANGNAIALSDKTFFDVENVTWAHDTDKSILEFPDGSKVLYDFASNQQVTLQKHWEDFAFSPDDNQIAAKAIGNNSDNRFLIVANSDGSNAKAIEELGDNQDKVEVNWSPNDQVVAFGYTADPIGFDRQQIIMVGKNKENFKNLVVEGRGFVPNWSPDGRQILYSVYNESNGYKPSLWISGGVGDEINNNRRSINIQTWADKCAWQSDAELICAVPESLGTGAGLQRELFANVPDNIVKINLQDGSMVNLGRPESSTVVDKMVVSSDGDSIMYTDRLTGKIVSFRL